MLAATCLGRVVGDKSEKAPRSDGICGEPAGTWVPLVLVQGSWKDTKTYLQARNRFTAACAAAKVHDPAAWRNPALGTLAKCVAFWSMHRDGNLVTACMQMAVAAYDGTVSQTRTGTPVDAWDKKGQPRPTHENGSWMAIHDWQYNTDPAIAARMCAMWLEAEWDQNGALCINHRRWEELPATVKPTFLPDKTFRLEGLPGEFNCRRGTRWTGGSADGGSAGSMTAGGDRPPGSAPELAGGSTPGGMPAGGSPPTALAQPAAFDDRDALVVNRSEYHLLDGGIGPLPIGDRALWDIADAVQLCGNDAGTPGDAGIPAGH